MARGSGRGGWLPRGGRAGLAADLHVRRPGPTWAPLALLAAFAVVQYLFLRPPFPSDSLSYFEWARQYPDVAPGHGPTRLGVIWPVRAAILVLDYSEAAYYVLPIASGILIVLATYRLGRQLFGWQAGLAAGLLLCTAPFFLESSSQIFPDTWASGLFVLGVSLFVDAAWGSAGGRRRDLLLVASGGLVGVAYLAREYVVFLLPLFLVAWLLSRLQARHLALVAAPVVVAFGLEVVVHWVLFDAPLARVEAVLGHDDRGDVAAIFEEYGEGVSRAWVLWRPVRTLVGWAVGPFLVAGLGVAGLLAVVRRDRRMILLLVWGALLWVPLMLLSGLIDPQQPLIRAGFLRYWFLVFPPLFLLAAGAAVAGTTWLRQRWTGMTRVPRVAVVAVSWLVVAALAGGNVWETYRAGDPVRFRVTGADQFDDLRGWFSHGGEDVPVLYTDARTARIVPLFTRTFLGKDLWVGELRVYNEGQAYLPIEEMRDGAVLIYSLGLAYIRNADRDVPEDYLSPGDGWHVELRQPDDSIVVFVPDAL